MNNREEIFSKVLAGIASSSEQIQFEEWLSGSKENEQKFQQYLKIWNVSGEIKKYNIDSAKLKTRIKILDKLKEKKGIFYYWQKIAAILILPLIVASVWFYLDKKDFIDSYSSTIETVKTPFGARTSLTLPDGSFVNLNSGSEISYPNTFLNERIVELKGEMYLEVVKSQKPFTVRTKYGSVRVLGTKFNISAYENETFATTLVEGAVAIKSKHEDLKLKPGFQAKLKEDRFEIEKVDVNTYTSWKEGKLQFRREPFVLVAKRLERWFNVKINLEGESIKNLWYTGTIEMESFSEVLEMIRNTTPIDYSFNSNTRELTIVSKMKQ